MRVAAAALAAHVVGGCHTALDCSLNGDCVAGQCRCDPAWSGSATCSVMAFDATTQNASLGYYNASETSWGGLPIQDSAGQWNLVYAQMLNGCPLSSWTSNSVVNRATGPSAEGPFAFAEELLPAFAHNPTVRKVGDDYVIWFIGGWHTTAKRCGSEAAADPASPAAPCSGAPAWAKTCGPNMPGPNNDTCGPGLNTGCGIALAHSKSLSGPWTVQRLVIEDRWRSDLIYCAYTNPSPHVLENGTVVMAFNAGFCHDGLETVGVATAPHWSGPYTLLTPDPVFSNSEPYDPKNPHHCEDPFIWQSKRGWHLLVHNQQGPQGESAYGYSEDAVHWTLSGDTPYDCTLRFKDGTSGTAHACGNRPQLHFDGSGSPTLLVNGAQGNDYSGAQHAYTLFRRPKGAAGR